MEESLFVVYGAAAANVAIAICKFIVAAITGSSAMLAEAIHSTVDTADGLLLLVGIRLSRRPPDVAHPFGHGRELYFWSMIVSIVIFGLGGGMSVYEGIGRVIHPKEMTSISWSYAVLGLAFVFESISWIIAVRHFQRTRPAGLGVFETVHRSKDPTQFIILFEDSAALIGLVIAFGGITLGHFTHRPVWDGIASILIGLVLAFVALVMARETKGLLVGESMDKERADAIRRLVAEDGMVEEAGTPLTMFLGPRDVLLNLDLRFVRSASLEEVEDAIDRLEQRIRKEFPEIHRIYLEAETLRPRPR